MSAEPTIVVSGKGMLAAAIASALQPDHDVIAAEQLTALDDRPSVLVVTSDGVQDFSFMAQHDGPWLPVGVEDGHVQVGPAVFPGVTGCPTCARFRRTRNMPNGPAWSAFVERFGTGSDPVRLTELSAAAGAALVRDQVRAMLEARSSSQVIRLSLDTCKTTTHFLLPDPLCPDCGDLPDDQAANARIPRRAVPKSQHDNFRVRDLVADWPELESCYVDTETGVVHSLRPTTEGICATVTALLEPAITHNSGHGFGRELDFAAAKVAALAEALERLGGQQPRGARTTVRAAYEDIAEHAVDPRTLGTYPEDRYALPGFRCVPYSPSLELSWVWAYSFGRAEPVLVPENVAYYGMRGHSEQIVYETSNGCALGGCLEEAVLHGLLEVAERDAFLLTWYARLRAPRVDLDSAEDRRIPLLAERARREFGYDVMAFDTTTEQGIPAYWLLGVDLTPSDDRPAVMCGAAAHMLPERALRNGLHEFITIAGGIMAGYDKGRAAAMLVDGDQVRAMDDHSLLYGHPDAASRLSFLPVDGPARPIRARTWPRHDNLGDDLAELVDRYLSTGLDVLAVNQTSAEHRAGGLAAAKVIVPGALPMTFGHVHRRDHGLPRIAAAPRLFGHLDRDLRPDEVNPDPHPFP